MKNYLKLLKCVLNKIISAKININLNLFLTFLGTLKFTQISVRLQIVKFQLIVAKAYIFVFIGMLNLTDADFVLRLNVEKICFSSCLLFIFYPSIWS